MPARGAEPRATGLRAAALDKRTGQAGNGEGVELDEAGLVALGAGLARLLAPPLVLFLEGELGAGKTTFARALIRGLGHAGAVKSPTYGLLEHYDLPDAEVLHLDLYRIGDAEEVEYLGLRDLLGARTVLLVEWPERGRGRLPAPDATLRLEHSGNKRRLYCHTHSYSGNVLCDSFHSLL